MRNWTFGQLLAASSRLANALAARGISKGDRVAVFLSQGAELTLCHLAGYRMGAVVLPLFTLFGEEALEYRLANAEASALITDMSQLPKVLAVRDRLPHLKTIIVIGAGAHGSAFLDWDRLLAAASDSFATVDTAAEDPALLIYTSGTTGQPKGALHAHRMMLGSVPPVEQWLSHWPRGNEVMWTPAEWAWIAGLYDALFPAWFYGTPVLAHRFAKFDPERAFALLAKAQGRRRLHPADRAQDDAAGRTSRASAGATTCAPSAPAARRWARNCWRGAATPSARRSRKATARPR